MAEDARRDNRGYDDANAVIRVADSGPGIPENQRAQIFEQFSRAVSNTRRWGMGLACGLLSNSRGCIADPSFSIPQILGQLLSSRFRSGHDDWRECCVRLVRTTTGIPALDQVIGGGLLNGGVYIVQGAAGSGKTILANQIAFSRAVSGGKVAYVTLLAESHARMIQHMELFSFYSEGAIPAAFITSVHSTNL